MSYRTLERMFVRLLFDPALVERMHADPDGTLDGLDLEPHERRQLLDVDRRAWRTDPLRRLRTLRTLVDEFKASTTLALAETRSVASLDAFFSADEFHGAVQHRGSMALGFAKYLDRLSAEAPISDPQFPDVLRLETTLARCRRELRAAPLGDPPAAEPPLDRVVFELAPGHAPGRYNANVLEAVNAVERYLFEVGLMPAVALCDDAPRLLDVPPAASEAAFLLALPSSSGISLMPIDADYFALLDQFSAGPVRARDAAKRAAAAGVPRDDLAGMLESLVEERVLVPARSR